MFLCVPVVALALAGCGGTEPSSSSESDESTPNGDEIMSWEEFQANVHRDPQRGVYIIDDEQGLNDAELRVVYERYVKTGALVVKPLGRR
ncbi:hypothetical protein WMF11_30205 [Sorangium sp. So ce295]|uniref:hypothetical protein n=1 Tax=unclassified Sorangium TaxID=2621164 RepID=UPI003F5F102A